jgi:hypothetical protein
VSFDLVKLMFFEGRRILPFYLTMDLPLPRGPQSGFLGNFIFSHAYYAFFCELFNECVTAGNTGVIKINAKTISEPFSETIPEIEYNQVAPGAREEAAERLSEDFNLMLGIEKTAGERSRASNYTFEVSQDSCEKMRETAGKLAREVLNRQKAYNNGSLFPPMSQQEISDMEFVKRLEKARKMSIPDNLRRLSFYFVTETRIEDRLAEFILSTGRIIPSDRAISSIGYLDLVLFFRELYEPSERESAVEINTEQYSIHVEDMILKGLGDSRAWYNGRITDSYCAIHFAIDGKTMRGSDLNRFFNYERNFGTLLYGGIWRGSAKRREAL